MFDDLLGQIADWAVRLMDLFGAPGVALAVALESIFPPLPSELVLPLAGFTAAQGGLVLWQVLVWATLGSLTGALALYGLGAWLGRDRLRRVVDRMPLVSLADLDRAEAFFDRHGTVAVLIGRLVPIVRSLISVPAGVERMSLPRFALFTTIGSAGWNTLLVVLGFWLGAQWHLVEDSVGIFSKIVLGLLALAVILFVVRRVRARRAHRPQRSLARS